MTPRQFSSAKAFRTSLEERLKTRARKEGLDLQRLRRQVAFDRLLARLFFEPEGPWVLKGGYAMELEFSLNPRVPRLISISPCDVLSANVPGRVQFSGRCGWRPNDRSKISLSSGSANPR